MPKPNNIDEMYNEMLSIGDKIATKGVSKDTMERYNNLSASVADYDDQKVDEEVSNTIIPDNNTIDPETLYQSIDPNTGFSIINDGAAGVAKCAEDQINNLIDNIDTDGLAAATIKKYNNAVSDNDVAKIITLINKRRNGITTGYFEGLPEYMQHEVTKVMVSADTSNIGKAHIKNKNYIARMFIDQIIKEMDNSIDKAFDLDTLFAEFDKNIEQSTNKLSAEVGSVLMNADDVRKRSIDAAIEKCTTEGNDEAVKRLTVIRNTIDTAYDLTDFKEFCKTCKIKRFETEKTKRVFDPFNAKYMTHKNTISDIRACPAILNRHLTNNTSKQNLMICLAFCKYCANMSPDNLEEHTFMYYFVRNIVVLDRINPRGEMYNLMDDNTKKYYDEFIKNLYDCSSNLSERNATLL